MDNLFEQMAQITKAHAYDIVSKQATHLDKALKDIETKINHPDITEQAKKAIHSDFYFLLRDIGDIIRNTRMNILQDSLNLDKK